MESHLRGNDRGRGGASAVANCAWVGDDRLLEFVCGIAARPDS